MERGAGCAGCCGPGRGQLDPLGGSLTSHVGPKYHGERPPCGVQGDGPEVPVERLPCRGETLTSTTKRLQEMSDIATPPQQTSDTHELPTVALPVVPNREPSPETGKDPSGIKLPPWLGKWGTSPGKDSPSAVPALPATPPAPAEKPSQSAPQQSVTRDWQKEIIVEPLDSQLGKDLDREDFRHGYHGLPIHQFLSSLTDSSSPKDCPRPRVLLLGQGQRKATLASMLYEKYSKETEEEIRPCPKRMESVSTTHKDYNAMGFQSTPQPTTQPHDYLTEEPASFWLEQARRLPGVTAFFGKNVPFKRNAAFSTPITLYLGHPEPFNLSDPYDPLSSQLQPHKQ